MAKQSWVVLAAVLVSLLLAVPASGQSVKGRTPANADLDARLKEVQGDPAQLDAYYKEGSKVASFCANCHGNGGNSVTGDVPNLAGQNPAYLLEQVRQFADGRRRNDFKERLIRVLSADERIAAAVFYAAQKVTHTAVADAKLIAKGREYYSKICFRCHGEDGRGNEKIARIAGQQSIYLALTIKRYRDGSAVRKDPLMAANTKTMTEDDIVAVVAYVSSLP